MSLNKANRKRVDVRIQVESRTTNGEVYHYLLSNPDWDLTQGKSMVNQAVRDYWLADARQSSDAELAKTTAIASIERMEYRISQLRQRFGLALPEQSRLDRPEVVDLLIQLASEVKLIPQALASISTAITSSGRVVQSAPVASAIVPAEPDDPVGENLFSAENVAEMLDLLGPLEEDLSADPNASREVS